MKRLARTDIAIQTRQLVHQAVWCGVVTGLAALLLMLNLMPPVEISYRVSGKLLTTAAQVQSLRDAMGSSNKLPSSEPTLVAVRILDRSKNELVSTSAPRAVLLGVESVWSSRCNATQFQSWLETVAATPQIARESASPQSSEIRLTQWQLETAKHYIKHQDYVGTDNKPTNNVFQLASTSGATNGTAPQLDPSLATQVQELEKRLADLSRDSRTQTSDPRVELTDAPALRPHSRRIPGWMAMSVIVLGIAVGASSGWLQLRLHSGGVFEPTDVADQLSKAGIPHVASLEITLDKSEVTDWISVASQRATEASRKGGRNLVLLGEGLLAFWCFLILARVCLDPLWRGLMLDSPLAALGRLLTGMP